MEGTKVPDLTYAQLRRKYDHNPSRTAERTERAEEKLLPLCAPDGTELGYMVRRDDGTLVPVKDKGDALTFAKLTRTKGA